MTFERRKYWGWRPALWVVISGAMLVSTGCASVNGFTWDYEPASLADRMEMRGCSISVPLTPDQVIEGARLMGNPSPETHDAWTGMKAAFREGDQLRYINCSEARRAVGADFFALIRNNVVAFKFAPMVY